MYTFINILREYSSLFCLQSLFIGYDDDDELEFNDASTLLGH